MWNNWSLNIIDSLIKVFVSFTPTLDTFFYIGTDGVRPTDAQLQGFPIRDERGSDQPLSSYFNKTIVLSLPSNRPDIFSARWFSIWSIGLKKSLADVAIPVEPNVPPSLDKLGIDPEVIILQILLVMLLLECARNIMCMVNPICFMCQLLPQYHIFSIIMTVHLELWIVEQKTWIWVAMDFTSWRVRSCDNRQRQKTDWKIWWWW